MSNGAAGVSYLDPLPVACRAEVAKSKPGAGEMMGRLIVGAVGGDLRGHGVDVEFAFRTVLDCFDFPVTTFKRSFADRLEAGGLKRLQDRRKGLHVGGRSGIVIVVTLLRDDFT